MKSQITSLLSKETGLNADEIEKLVEIPPSSDLGDYAFPCFVLSKQLKKNPVEIASDLAKKLKLKSKEFEKIEAKGSYVNFFINRTALAQETLTKIQKEKDKYGSSTAGKNKKIVLEFSSPNIAKPFGIGHLRSTIIGNSLAEITSFLGFKVIKMNYLGDWGTPFGKILAGYENFGSEKEFKKNPVRHLYDIYVKVSKDESYEQKARDVFKSLEAGDKKLLDLWKKFRSASIKEFEKIYSSFGIKFDATSFESQYKELDFVVKEMERKNIIKESDGALIVDLENFNLGVCLIKKSDGSTLYATRDLAAALDRYKRYKFDSMIYEVGAEQKLYFKQLFKILEMLGNKWAKHCVHAEHGLYLDKDGKKLATRHGRTVFMESIIEETKELAKKEILKREKLPQKALDSRAESIALASIFYGDLKNYRSSDMVFDIERFISFEGDTGPYLLYAYARAKSILKKAKYIKKKSFKVQNLTDLEKLLVNHLSLFPDTVEGAYKNLDPSAIAHYAYKLSQVFNEFYHSSKVIGSENEDFKLSLVDSFSQVLKNALKLLGIKTIEKM